MNEDDLAETRDTEPPSSVTSVSTRFDPPPSSPVLLWAEDTDGVAYLIRADPGDGW